MASRLLPPSIQLRLRTAGTPSCLQPSRSISASSARAARTKRRPTTAPRKPTGQPSSINAAAAAAVADFDEASPSSRRVPPSPASATASGPKPSNSPFADPSDPLNLKPHTARLGGGGGGQQQLEEPVFRMFEQTDPNKPPRPVTEARIEADSRAAAEVWRKIVRLEREVHDIEHGDDAELDAHLMRLRAIGRESDDPADAGAGVAAARDFELLEDADPAAVRRDMDALRVARAPAATPDPRAAACLAQLNNCLRHAYLATQPSQRPVVRQELWKAYKRAKRHVPGLLHAIPDPAWDMLFYTQAVRWKSNEKREQHVSELLADMKAVGMDGPPTKPPARSLADAIDEAEEAEVRE